MINMNFTKEQEEILDKCLQNKIERDYYKCLGTGCHKLIKLTEEKAIFKPCHSKGNITYYFDYDEFDDKILYYMLQREGGVGTHWYIKREIGLFPNYLKKELNTEEMEKEIEKIILAFGKVYLTDIMNYLNVNGGVALDILSKLKKKGVVE